MTLHEDSPPDEIFYLPEHQAEREASSAMRSPFNQLSVLCHVLPEAQDALERIAEFVGAAEQEQEPRHVTPK
jgi:hypothetical protein